MVGTDLLQESIDGLQQINYQSIPMGLQTMGLASRW